MKQTPRNHRRQRGLASVETALVAGVVLTILFGVFEVARLFFVANALEEATRRGARVAAVCLVDDAAVMEIAVFNASGGGGNSPLVGGLSSADVTLEYISFDGTVVGDPVADYFDIDAVRVAIRNFQHDLIIPFFMQTITMPEFETTIPRESLGVTREGFTTC